MSSADKFTAEDVQRIVGLTPKQLEQWSRLRLISPQLEEGTHYYDFRDLIGLRTIKQLLESGVTANRLQRTLAALKEKLSQVHSPLSQLRILSDGKDLVVEQGSARLEPLSGQFVLNFETRELDEGIHVIANRPTPKHNADDWLAAALHYESESQSRAHAFEAYDRCLAVDPNNIDALLNCGTLHYEDGRFEKAAEYFRRALAFQPGNALAHYNLGSVLEEMGQLDNARGHLRQAVSIDPSYSDAHYNLAFVCEKLRAFPEARQHWQAYIRLDPTGPWSAYARRRLSP
jgi:tetratricopeptide (TPR) repeat protein